MSFAFFIPRILSIPSDGLVYQIWKEVLKKFSNFFSFNFEVKQNNLFLLKLLFLSKLNKDNFFFVFDNNEKKNIYFFKVTQTFVS